MNPIIHDFGWWIEIITIKPICIYYFGVFDSIYEAEQFKDGYIEDLAQEKAEIVNMAIKQCQPRNLTIYVESKKSSKSAIRQSRKSPVTKRFSA
ncbi:MAG: DUF1816 domain-containing protein [Xenococcaceae cyanobacterium MO_188.B19]|nr:DUF1816 domain-containing protein [Xenococcaceae cyanobacterium MO_188.B19]